MVGIDVQSIRLLLDEALLGSNIPLVVVVAFRGLLKLSEGFCLFLDEGMLLAISAGDVVDPSIKLVN